MRLLTRHGDALRRLDSNRLDSDTRGVQLYSCVRNELLRLPYFLDYYRRLGVSRFFIVDNASTDGTANYLSTLPDVHLFSTDGSYAANNYGVDWLHCLLGEFGSERWTLVVDADELLVFRDSEGSNLGALIRRLEECGSDALLTFMLDMYADCPLRAARYVPGTSFTGTCPYFDLDSYTLGTEGLWSKIPERGGVRRRLFWKGDVERRGKPPYLSKIPFLKWSTGREFLVSTHRIEGVRLAPFSGVLLHFKLFSDFVEKTRIEVERAEHWDGAAQYSVYAEALIADPDLNPMYEGSVRYRDSRQLIELGLMIDDAGPNPPV